MRTESKLFGLLAVFFLIVTPVYYFMSHELAGTAVLTLSFFLVFMVSGYLALISRKIDPRPEDRSLGDVHEGAGELGFFPPRSVWPVVCAAILCVFLMGPELFASEGIDGFVAAAVVFGVANEVAVDSGTVAVVRAGCEDVDKVLRPFVDPGEPVGATRIRLRQRDIDRQNAGGWQIAVTDLF